MQFGHLLHSIRLPINSQGWSWISTLGACLSGVLALSLMFNAQINFTQGDSRPVMIRPSTHEYEYE